MKRQVVNFPDQEALSLAAARGVVAAAARAIERQGWFALVLSGGSSPRRLFELLAGPELAGQIDWSATHIFWSDERCVDPADDYSNYRLARTVLLEHIEIPSCNIHRMRGEIEAQQAALASERDIRDFFAQRMASPVSMPSFDLVLLGMGADGHTASLFPGDDTALHENDRLVIATGAPEGMPVRRRLSMSAALLSNARDIFFIVPGRSHKPVLEEVLSGGPAAQRYPAARISARERIVWFVSP
jgi:6-phosphogluconolactonase